MIYKRLYTKISQNTFDTCKIESMPAVFNWQLVPNGKEVKRWATRGENTRVEGKNSATSLL
jgi:hypothetical protein